MLAIDMADGSSGMDAPHGGLDKLVSLARARTPEARRALIRDITDLFMTHAELRAGTALAHVDTILTDAAGKTDAETRRDLARRFGESEAVPDALSRRLMADAIEIAEPLLTQDNGVPEAALEEVARTGGASHQRCLARRPNLAEAVSDALISREDEETLIVIAHNATAKLSRDGFEKMVDAAETLDDLRRPLADRTDMPPDLLHEMYFLVDADQRAAILARTAKLTPEEAKLAFDAARARLYRILESRPPDYEDAVRFLQARLVRGGVTPAILLDLLEKGERTRFFACFAHVTGLTFEAAKRVTENPASAPFAAVCRAAELPANVFITLALLRPTLSQRADSDPEVLEDVYSDVPVDVAKRVIRFWRVREAADQNAGSRAA